MYLHIYMYMGMKPGFVYLSSSMDRLKSAIAWCLIVETWSNSDLIRDAAKHGISSGILMFVYRNLNEN